MMTNIEYDFDKTCRSCLCTTNDLKSIHATIVNANIKQNGNGSGTIYRRTRRSYLDSEKDEKHMKIDELILACAKVRVSSLQKNNSLL